MTHVKLGELAQLGYVVPEAGYDAAIERWTRCGVGPFFEIPHVKLAKQRYRGEPTDVDMSIALAYSGPMQIEIIVQHNDAPSLYLDFLKEVPDGGLQHMAFISTDYAAAIAHLESLGMPLLQEWTDTLGNQYGYCERTAAREPYTEVLQASDALLGLFKHVRKAGVDWDGTQPRRTLGG